MHRIRHVLRYSPRNDFDCPQKYSHCKSKKKGEEHKKRRHDVALSPFDDKKERSAKNIKRRKNAQKNRRKHRRLNDEPNVFIGKVLVIAHHEQREHHHRKQKEKKYSSACNDKQPVEKDFFTAVIKCIAHLNIVRPFRHDYSDTTAEGILEMLGGKNDI